MTLRDFFKETGTIKVPSYQRAYAWEQKHLEDFISDLLEITKTDGGTYYYGHFVVEQTKEGYTNVIDGQQRLTTLILFLLVAKSLNIPDLDKYIDHFQTVDYDTVAFEKMKQVVQDNPDWDKKALAETLDDKATLSINRILFSLNYFRESFNKQSDLSLRKEDLQQYIDVLLSASVSCHGTESKAVAAQIFELHNSRGVQLTTLEKVKSKLMKAAYVHGKTSAESDIAVEKIQGCFAEIYRFEELISSLTFRGNLSLDGLLFHHLRVVDDGKKDMSNKGAFNEPSRNGNREELILSYLDKRLSQGNALCYAQDLAEKFEDSTKFVGEMLPALDYKNILIGDVLILDRSLSLEFLLLLHHKGFQKSLNNPTIIRLWEILLFTRDFHGKYYNLQYRDDFQRLFRELAVQSESAHLKILSDYVEKGFRPERMDFGSLRRTVNSYLENAREDILNEAFNFWLHKMTYILYKYEIRIDVNIKTLRQVVRRGLSVEHILPRSWEWKWINEDEKSVTEKGSAFNKTIEGIINGIGNLLIISKSENSSLSNSHPSAKEYYEIKGGTYERHNTFREEWSNPENWTSLIKNRGEKIYAFLQEFVKPPEV